MSTQGAKAVNKADTASEASLLPCDSINLNGIPESILLALNDLPEIRNDKLEEARQSIGEDIPQEILNSLAQAICAENEIRITD